jgi:hypothetical protein
MRLRHDPEKGVGRPDEVLAELGERIGRRFGDVTLVRTGLTLAEPRGTSQREGPVRRPIAGRGSAPRR